MAVNDLVLTVDIVNKVLVALNGTPTALPPQFQTNTANLQIFCVVPSQTSLPIGTGTSIAYLVQNMAAFGLRAAVGATPEGESAPGGSPGPAPIALQTIFNWDAVSQSFLGTLSLNSVAVDDFIGEASQQTAFFELNLTIAGTRITILQTAFLLKANVDQTAGGAAPTPTNDFYTKEDSDNRYVKKVGLAGETFILTSPDGTKQLEIGVDNNGELSTNLV